MELCPRALRSFALLYAPLRPPAPDETPGIRTGAGFFGWILRGFVVWGLASVLGYF